MSFFSALGWTLGFGALLLYLILRLLLGAFKGAKGSDKAGTSVGEEKHTARIESLCEHFLRDPIRPERTLSSRMDITSGELFYPGGLVDREPPDNVPRSSQCGPTQPIAQVGRETVHIRLGSTRRRILSSDSSAEEEEERCPKGRCFSEVNSLVSSSRVVPLSKVTSERRLTTVEKREERKADVRLSLLSKRTELGSDQAVSAPLPEATGCDSAPEAEPLAAPSGRPVKSHRDQVLEQKSSDERGGLGAYDDDPRPTAIVPQRPQSLLAGFRRVGPSSANEDDEMSMAMASPENCQKLSRCLTSETQTNERGVAMFMRQRQRADKYTIDEETPRRTPLPRSFAATPTRPSAFQPAKIRPDELLESVRAAASRRERTTSKPVPHSRRSTSVEPDRHRWTGIVSPFDYAIGAQTPSSYELPTTKAKGVRFMNGPVNDATEPLYIQCYDRPSVEYSRPSAAPQTVGSNFNSLPRGWKSYKANLKAPSLR